MRFEKMSEDPVAGQQVLSLRSLKNRIDQLDKNLRSADEYVGLTSNALTDLNDMFQRSYSLALQGANDATGQQAKEAMAVEIESMQKRLIDLGNERTSTGGYLFSGQDTKTKAFVQNGTTIAYQGDDLPMNVEIRPGEQQRVNLSNTGSFFTDLYDKLETLKNDLRSGNTSTLGDTDVDAMQQALRSISDARGQFGVLARSVATQKDLNAKRIDDLTARLGDAQEVDVTQAVTDMQLAQTAYTAALQVAAQGSRLSLMDFIQ
jgi:flagellar hook-associated protein 3 FlgL